MCGIAGVWHSEADVGLDLLRPLAAAIRHRGPDDAGYLIDDPARWAHPRRYGAEDRQDGGERGCCGLAFRRLAIIDIATGAQPMASADGQAWIVFNGEIYNYRLLRGELEARGRLFRTKSDTEVILEGYLEHGPDFVKRLNGIFAFAIWDRRKRRLFLARDRLGIKPLYHTSSGNRFAFASEVKALLRLPWVRPAPDLRGLAEHFTFQNTFGERTLFEGIAMLPAGHTMTFADGSVEVRRYWDLHFEEDGSRTLRDWATDLRDVFTASVTAQLMSEVPLGSYLSGGMDTGAIAAVAARHIKPLNTFTCGFEAGEEVTPDERLFDERLAAAELANELGTRHHEVTLGPFDMARLLPHVVWHLDEPRVGISYQNYAVARLARSRVTVVLSGVGGDELFGGYPWRYRKLAEVDGESAVDRYYEAWQRLVPADQLGDFFSATVLGAISGFSPRDSVREVLKEASGDPMNRAMYFDAKTFLHGLLVVEDKLSMAHSVESRVPFLDNDLIDLVRRIPSAHKVNATETKVVLKAALADVLPHGVLTRRKIGFTPPDASWFRGPSAGAVEAIILSDRFLDRGYFRPEAVIRIVEEHMSGQRNHRFLLWSLMAFDWWHRLFIEDESLPDAGAAPLIAQSMEKT